MDPVIVSIAYFVLAYGWPIYLPVLVLVAGTLFGAVLFAVLGAIRSGFHRSGPADEDEDADDVDVAEFFESRTR